jgi:hypothetical protein
MLENLPPAQLTDEDWLTIEEAFAPDSMFLPYLRKIRQRGNVPTMAQKIFDGSLILQGHEQINHVLRLAELPYRLIRIGPLSALDNSERLLAIVVLPKKALDALKR